MQVLATDFDWNPWAPKNTLRIGPSEVMQDSFEYNDIPKVLSAFVAMCQKRDN